MLLLFLPYIVCFLYVIFPLLFFSFYCVLQTLLNLFVGQYDYLFCIWPWLLTQHRISCVLWLCLGKDSLMKPISVWILIQSCYSTLVKVKVKETSLRYYLWRVIFSFPFPRLNTTWVQNSDSPAIQPITEAMCFHAFSERREYSVNETVSWNLDLVCWFHFLSQ